MSYTLGFIDAYERAEHFDKHVIRGKEFNVATDIEYEALADEFLGKPLDNDTYECYRTRRDGTIGDKIRYNKVTQEYGILSNDNIIRSYYIANPARHRWPTNFRYFRWDCGRIKD